MAIIAGICDGVAYRNFLQNVFEKRFIEYPVINFSRGYFKGSGGREVGRDDRGMKLLAKKEGVLIFHASKIAFIGRRFLIRMNLNVCGINGEGSFSFPFEIDSLGDHGLQNFFELFLSYSFLNTVKVL